MRVTEGELIECRECGFIFSLDEADICRRCKEHICPKCEACGCIPRDKLHLQPRFA